MKGIILLDRDGTVIAEKHYLSCPDQVELLPGAAEGIARLANLGLGVVVVTNQSGIGRGYFSHADLERVHHRLEELLAREGARVEGFFVCPHHPDEACVCRKPAPGLARQAAEALGADLTQSFVIGDKPCDVELGQAVGATTILVRTGYGARVDQEGTTNPDHVVDTLREAALLIERTLREQQRAFWQGRRVLVTGGTGFIGRNLLPLLAETGCELIVPTRSECDLREQEQVRHLLARTSPRMVIHLAGLVGGNLANLRRPAEFAHDNLLMGTLLLHESWRAGVAKYVSLLGACSYPAQAPNPIREDELWNGPPQAESAPYALAKGMSVVLAQSYRRQYGFDAVVLVPGNVYGPHDHFDLESSHVIPALIRKFDEAVREGKREVPAWGTGKPVRDFAYVEDVCQAVVHAARVYGGGEIINLASGVPTTIRDLVETVAELMGYPGAICWDESKPDGQMFKGLDVTRMRRQLGLELRTSLREGLRKTIAWYRGTHFVQNGR